MQIASIVKKTQAEGPGVRAAVWVQGCTINCPECCNQEYLEPGKGDYWNPKNLAYHLCGLDVEGISLLGGEPLQQIDELLQLLQEIRNLSSTLSIMLFTGYTWKAITGNSKFHQAVNLCDLIIAGPYIAKLKAYDRRWIGSSNQTIHFVTEKYRHLEKDWPLYQKEIEFCIRDGEIVISGTPLDDLTEKFPSS